MGHGARKKIIVCKIQSWLFSKLYYFGFYERVGAREHSTASNQYVKQSPLEGGGGGGGSLAETIEHTNFIYSNFSTW